MPSIFEALGEVINQRTSNEGSSLSPFGQPSRFRQPTGSYSSSVWNRQAETRHSQDRIQDLGAITELGKVVSKVME